MLGGVKMPSERSDAIRSRHHARDSSVTPKASFAVSWMGTSGFGLVSGKGCNGHAFFTRDVAGG
jgi:hypothetical protein